MTSILPVKPTTARIQPTREAPVSYTHLDVYKRQVLDFLVFNCAGLSVSGASVSGLSRYGFSVSGKVVSGGEVFRGFSKMVYSVSEMRPSLLRS